MNPETLTPLPTTGRGFVTNTRGNHQPGEFRELKNLELYADGSIRTRRGLRPVDTTAQGNHMNAQTSGWDDMDGFVGMYKEHAMIAGFKAQKIVSGEYGVTDCWSPSVMNTVGHAFGPTETAQYKINSTTTDWRKIVGFIRYNKINYWIIQSYIEAVPGPSPPPGSYCEFHLVYAADYSGSPVAINPVQNISKLTYANLFYAKIAQVALSQSGITGAGAVSNPNPFYGANYLPKVKSFFIHKDRLWIVTDKALYFSKATDPTVWISPFGGYVSFTDSQINDAVAFGDSIYIVCDGSTWSLTYTNDPNTNATLRQISDSLGGDSIVIWAARVYFIRDNALYAVTDANVSKVLDMSLYPEIADSPQRKTWQLVSAGDYIIAVSRIISMHNSSQNPPASFVFPNGFLNSLVNFRDFHRYYSITNTIENSSVDYLDAGTTPPRHDAFFINMNTGSVNAFSTLSVGYLQDVIFANEDNETNDQTVYFMYGQPANIGAGSLYYTDHWIYKMMLNQSEYTIANNVDRVMLDSFTGAEMGIPIDIEWSQFSADEAEFFLKRFRKLLLEGNLFPGCKLLFGYDNESYLAPIIIPNTVEGSVASARPPFSLQIPMNQKARSVNIRLYKPYADSITSVGVTDHIGHRSFVTLTQAALTWSTTVKGPVGSRPLNKDSG